MSGPRVLLTRAVGPVSDWIEPMRRIGVRLEARDVLRFEPLPVAVDAALNGADALVLTSGNGALFFRRALDEQARSPETLPPIAVVGASTARRARDLGLPVSRIGSGGAAELCEELRRDLEPCPLVWVRPEEAHAEPFEALEAAGFTVRPLVAYRTLPVEGLDPLGERIRRGEFAAVVLTSPSAFRALSAVAGSALASTRRVALGRTTARALRDAGLPADEVAERPDPEAVADALKRLLLC